VKGLLKQVYSDFNISSCWKELTGRDSNGDQSLEWSIRDASRLQRKLQFHEGTAKAIGMEAYELASGSSSPGMSSVSGCYMTVALPDRTPHSLFNARSPGNADQQLT
jgi:hypothetical protein